jgi:hypothetical protein
MTTKRRRTGWGTGAALFCAIAVLIALDPVVSGDNYCGRLYFDTHWIPACRTPLAMRAGWFLALGGAAVVIAAGLLVTARKPRVLGVAALGAVALISVLIGFNRLLQPVAPAMPPRVQAFCGSVLNRHESPFDQTFNNRCDDLLGPNKRAAALALGIGATAGAAACGAAFWPSKRPRESPPPHVGALS